MRGCWEAAPVTDGALPDPVRIIRPAAGTPQIAKPPPPPSGRLDFIPVGPAPRKRARRPARPPSAAAGIAPDPVLGFWGEEP